MALEPAVSNDGETESRSFLSDFLKGLEVRIADRLALSPKGTKDFDIVPFDAKSINDRGVIDVSETDSELSEGELASFQARVRRMGAQSAYRLGDKRYVIIDPSARPVLEAMVEMQRADPETRGGFLRKPGPRIAAAIEAKLRADGRLDGLSAEGVAEAIEKAASAVFIETKEYSQRVLGITEYKKPSLPPGTSAPTTWLPEGMDETTEALERMDAQTLQRVVDALQTAVDQGSTSVAVEGLELPTTPELLAALRDRLREIGDHADRRTDEPSDQKLRIILDTLDNLDSLRWNPTWRPRVADELEPELVGLKSKLHSHQQAAFLWQVQAWAAGMPGVLNADEQGLGKTVETLAFLRWLADDPVRSKASRGPILIVAPTSLLNNWVDEVEKHLDERGLGSLLRLYGSNLAAVKSPGRGFEIETGEERLNLEPLHNATAEGRGSGWWVITTYDTLTNYQHSLARVPFSVAVFDEMQAVKNPGTLRHSAARAVKADFRIGLTGTPIENTPAELWAIMDVLAPGALGSLHEYLGRFGEPDNENMSQLWHLLFERVEGRPPIALRRLKENVAADLPIKTRWLHPDLMPELQARAYEAVRAELLGAKRGHQLKLLHRIRTVSLHPSRQENMDADAFIAASARLNTTFEILRKIQERGERALIFIEDRQLQHRLALLLQAEFQLSHIDILNGTTPIDRRRQIVARFQRHLSRDEGFDILILAPRAAGTGLTLTAAQHVIHLSRWWNPAVEEQCNDRVHRIGQQRAVEVHVPIAIHPQFGEQSFDCHLQALMMRKRGIARAVLWPLGDTVNDVSELMAKLGDAAVRPESSSAADALRRLLERVASQSEWRQVGETFVLS